MSSASEMLWANNKKNICNASDIHLYSSLMSGNFKHVKISWKKYQGWEDMNPKIFTL